MGRDCTEINYVTAYRDLGSEALSADGTARNNHRRNRMLRPWDCAVWIGMKMSKNCLYLSCREESLALSESQSEREPTLQVWGRKPQPVWETMQTSSTFEWTAVSITRYVGFLPAPMQLCQLFDGEVAVRIPLRTTMCSVPIHERERRHVELERTPVIACDGKREHAYTSRTCGGTVVLGTLQWYLSSPIAGRPLGCRLVSLPGRSLGQPRAHTPAS